MKVWSQVLHDFQFVPLVQFSNFLDDDCDVVLDTSSVDDLSDL